MSSHVFLSGKLWWKDLRIRRRFCALILGYGTETKGYRLYDLKHAKVLYSQDVIFNEYSRGIEEPNEENKKKMTPYVEFGHLPDQEPDEQPVADDLESQCCQDQKGREGHLTTMENGQLSQALNKMSQRLSKKN